MKRLLYSFLLFFIVSCTKNKLQEKPGTGQVNEDAANSNALLFDFTIPGGISYSPSRDMLYMVTTTEEVLYLNMPINALWARFNYATGEDVAISYTTDPAYDEFPIVTGQDRTIPWFPAALDRNTTWTMAGYGLAKRIASEEVGGSYPTKLWCIGNDNHIWYRFNNHTSYLQSSWTLLPGGGMGKDIDVYNGTPYVVGMDSKPYYYSGGAWYLLPGGGLLRRIAVDKANGKLWGVGTDAQVWYYSSSNTWIAYPQYHFGGTVVDICVYNDIPYIYITDGAPFHWAYKGTGTGWIGLGG